MIQLLLSGHSLSKSSVLGAHFCVSRLLLGRSPCATGRMPVGVPSRPSIKMGAAASTRRRGTASPGTCKKRSLSLRCSWHRHFLISLTTFAGRVGCPRLAGVLAFAALELGCCARRLKADAGAHEVVGRKHRGQRYADQAAGLHQALQ